MYFSSRSHSFIVSFNLIYVDFLTVGVQKWLNFKLSLILSLRTINNKEFEIKVFLQDTELLRVQLALGRLIFSHPYNLSSL